MNTSTRRALIGAILLAATLLAALWLAGASGGARTVVRPTPLKPPPTAEPLVPTPLPSFRSTALPRPSQTPTAESRLTATATQRADQPPVATNTTDVSSHGAPDRFCFRNTGGEKTTNHHCQHPEVINRRKAPIGYAWGRRWRWAS